ncbi:MAG: DNA polymerase III subunit delta [Gammaproteobacteria bacterium]|nr:DNA polymerase III subunit delta [Gammaproteobacteria bacterium]MDH3749958.1 DNA polymerase III subunit delta [Gammaproteobacteria bacterium]MDH3806312.1 DNA polymerase III subunit delta [Gammaproteobacteria bacterium]
MKLKVNQLSSHLQKNLAPCYLVTGDEHLLVAEALDAIRESARQHGFTSRELHIASQGFDWAQLRDSSANLSLFAEKKIVELRLPTGKPGRSGSQAIVDLVETTDSDLLLIVSGPKLDRGGQASKWAKSLEAKGVNIQVWPVGVRELPGWIAERMRQAGLQPDREAVALIADRVEGNLLAAGQEIEKLRLILGEGKVTAADVNTAVANSSRYDVFNLVDAALTGNAKRALKILSGLRAEGVEPVIVVWALTRELRTLASLTDTVSQGMDLASGMQKTGVWRNRQALVRSCIGRHQHGDFHRLLKAASHADQAAKGQSPADPWQLSTDIVLGMSIR